MPPLRGGCRINLRRGRWMASTRGLQNGPSSVARAVHRHVVMHRGSEMRFREPAVPFLTGFFGDSLREMR
jgi:hypothetical protein